MTNMNHRPPASREWLRRMADAEDRCESVSVGGLAHDLGLLGSPTAVPHVTRSALAKLIEFSRRRLGLSPEQLADKADIDLAELVSIERGEDFVPEPRTIVKLSQVLKLPTQSLLGLAGLVQRTDTRLSEAAIRFAASSEPMEKLSAEEQRLLQNFVNTLAELTDRG